MNCMMPRMELERQTLDVARYLTQQAVRWAVIYDEPDTPTVASILQLVTADPASIAAAKAEIDQVIGTL